MAPDVPGLWTIGHVRGKKKREKEMRGDHASFTGGEGGRRFKERRSILQDPLPGAVAAGGGVGLLGPAVDGGQDFRFPAWPVRLGRLDVGRLRDNLIAVAVVRIAPRGRLGRRVRYS